MILIRAIQLYAQYRTDANDHSPPFWGSHTPLDPSLTGLPAANANLRPSDPDAGIKPAIPRFQECEAWLRQAEQDREKSPRVTAADVPPLESMDLIGLTIYEQPCSTTQTGRLPTTNGSEPSRCSVTFQMLCYRPGYRLCNDT